MGNESLKMRRRSEGQGKRKKVKGKKKSRKLVPFLRLLRSRFPAALSFFTFLLLPFSFCLATHSLLMTEIDPLDRAPAASLFIYIHDCPADADFAF